MKVIQIILAGFLMLAAVQPAGAADYRQVTAQKVLDKLFQTAGYYKFKQPVLELTKDNRKVAAYYPARNKIVLDEKAYAACRSMGKDSLEALAFVLGHELTHSFQVEIRDGKVATNFLSYDRTIKAPVRIEKAADIQGIFIGYLAGFRMTEVVPKILNRIYEDYGLRDKPISGYPTFEERSNSAGEVLATVNDLIDLFEASNYLIVAENYKLAATSLEYILKYYQGREIYNNLGVLYLLSAMDFFDSQTDRFVYPIEMDASTQLEKIKKARGQVPLSPMEIFLRTRSLEKAMTCFREALNLDKNYASAKLNLVCALNLLNKPKEASEFFKKQKLLVKKRSGAGYEKLRLAFAITSARLNDIKTAEATFNALAHSAISLHAAQAQYNLDVLHGREVKLVSNRVFKFPEDFIKTAKSLELGRVSQLPNLELDAESGTYLKKDKKGNSATFSFGDGGGSILSFIRYKNSLAPNVSIFENDDSLDRQFFYNLVETTDGYFLKTEDKEIALKVDLKGKVLEMSRFFKHR